jgi:hypothetical protein
MLFAMWRISVSTHHDGLATVTRQASQLAISEVSWNQVRAIRARLPIEHNKRDLAMSNLAIADPSMDRWMSVRAIYT